MYLFRRSIYTIVTSILLTIPTAPLHAEVAPPQAEAISSIGTTPPAISTIPDTAASSDNFIRVIGRKFYTNGGNGVEFVPNGVVLSNALVIEPLYTAIGGPFTTSTEDDNHAAIQNELIRRFASDALITQFQNTFIQDSDIAFIKSLGLNTVTIPVYYKDFRDINGNYTDFTALDRLVNLCATHGLYVIIDLFRAPGGQNDIWGPSQNKLFENSLTGLGYRLETIEFWDAVSNHYKDNETILAYNLLAEPSGAEVHDQTLSAPHGLWQLYDDLYLTIRGNNDEHIIMMSSFPRTDDWSTLPNPSVFNWTNTAYQLNFAIRADDAADTRFDLTLEDYVDFFGQKLALNRQAEYNNPVLIGQYSGLENPDVWRFLFNILEDINFGGMVFNFKTAFNPQVRNGLFIHDSFQNETVDVTTETLSSLNAKISRFDTSQYTENTLVTDLLRSYNLDGPEIDPIADQTINQNQPFVLDIAASHPAGKQIAFEATLLPGYDVATLGINFRDNNDGTAEFAWTPFTGQSGTNTIVITATDEDGIVDIETFDITVNEVVVIAQITSPVPGSVIDSSNITVSWSSGTNVTEYFLGVDETLSGLSNSPWGRIFAGSTNRTSVDISGIRLNGQPVYMRLWSRIGGEWYFEDYSFTSDDISGNLSQLITPAPGSQLTTSTVNLAWTAGTNVDANYLAVSTDPSLLDGVPYGDIFAGGIFGTTQTVTSIPLTGQTIYVRLWSRVNGFWSHIDYQYTTSDGLPELTSPAPGGTLTASDTTFQWSPGDGVSSYFIGVGTSAQSVAASPWGNIFKGTTTGTSQLVTGIPLNGKKVYVRLWARIGAKWFFKDYSYDTSTTNVQRAQLTAPAAGTTISTNTVNFQWTRSASVESVFLGVGTSASSVNSAPYGNIFSGTVSGTQVSVSSIPLTGNQVHVRLWSRVGGVWLFDDYTFQTIVGVPQITSPIPGTSIAASSVEFQWTAGTNIEQYFLGVGTSADSISKAPWGNIFTGTVSGTSQVVTGIRPVGVPIYVRLWYKISGKWYFDDYTYP